MSEQIHNPRVFLVGHCGPDSFALQSSVRSQFPTASFEMINDQSSLDAGLGKVDLLLVNRVLDGQFSAGNGIELIESILVAEASSKAMLISNFADAQAEAEAAGAVPGFGKLALYDAQTKERLAAALEADKAA